MELAVETIAASSLLAAVLRLAEWLGQEKPDVRDILVRKSDQWAEWVITVYHLKKEAAE